MRRIVDVVLLIRKPGQSYRAKSHEAAHIH